MRYTYDTWSVELPEFWVAEEMEECVLLYNGESEVGAFQISSFFKEDENAVIKDEDLLEFADSANTQAVVLPFLDGIFYQDVAEDYVSLYWCLRSGSELIFITYSCDVHDIETEQVARDVILNSLRSQY